MKENDQKKKGAKERDTWVQLELHPDKDNELTCELLETILYEFIAQLA